MKNKNIFHINNFFIIFIFYTLFQIIKNSPTKEPKQQSSSLLRYLVQGNDIVKQINEQCIDNANLLKYTIVLNSTAFLLYLNDKRRRNLNTYTSLKELNGQNIGVITGKTYADLITINCPNSQLIYYDSTNSLMMALLQGKIKGFLLEEPVAEYYDKQMNAITYINNKISKDNYGFGLSKNMNDKFRRDFDQYLFAIKLEGTYDTILKTWTGDNNAVKIIDKNLIGNNGIIKVGLNIDVPPFSYQENNEILGFEVDILYRFAQKYGYQIEINTLTLEEQLNKINSREIDLAAGCFSITEQRRLSMEFTSSIYEGGPVVVIENQLITTGSNNNYSNNKKVIVKNHQNLQNLGNILNFPVTGLPDGQTHSGTCTFPEDLTEIYQFECIIPGLTESNPMINGYTYGLITDYIEVDGITINSVYSYIPSHILGYNNINNIEHPGTICPRINLHIAGVDNIYENLNNIKLDFGLYRKINVMPKTQAKLNIKKGSTFCIADCVENGNIIHLSNLDALVRYSCSCNLTSSSNSDYFKADFNTISFYYINDISKKINMSIYSKESTKSAMANLNKNMAIFPSNLTNLNTLIVTKLNNGRCLNGKFTFNAIGVLYKSIQQEQYFAVTSPINSNFILKIPYDLEEAESQMSINGKVRGILMIRKDYYENYHNKGEYLYLTSNDDVIIEAMYCEGYGNGNISSGYKERVETVALRDEMSIPKWLIITLILIFTLVIMSAIYSYIQKLDNETEYVIKYSKNNSTSTNLQLSANQK